jgi:hypothetical protein
MRDDTRPSGFRIGRSTWPSALQALVTRLRAGKIDFGVDAFGVAGARIVVEDVQTAKRDLIACYRCKTDVELTELTQELILLDPHHRPALSANSLVL